MMENLRPEEETIIKDARSLFRQEKLKKETNDTTIKEKKNLFRLEKENKVIKDKIIGYIKNVFGLKKEKKAIKNIILRNIRNLFENEEEENFSSHNYIKYESNGDRNKALSDEEHLNKIRPYLKVIVNNLKKI